MSNIRGTEVRGPVNSGSETGDNDNSRGAALASSSSLTGGAVAVLATLGTTLGNVNITSIVGGSGRPLLLFKSRENGGTWSIGQKKTEVEAGSRWAANPTSIHRGYVSFDGSKKVGEKLLPISLPMIDRADLPDTGFPWTEEWAIDMKCLDGADAGKEVIFKASTDGGRQAIGALIAAIQGRYDSGGKHDGNVVPVALLEKYDYPHPQYGKTINPLLTVVEWLSIDGPATAPTPTPPPTSPAAEQPRRRRAL